MAFLLANATPYRAVSWNVGDHLSLEKLNKMTDNDAHLFEEMPRAIYRGYGVRQSDKIKILGGNIQFNPNKKGHHSKEVNFNGIFVGGTNPIIVTQSVSSNHHRVFVNVHGIGRKAIPDSRGFVVELTHAPIDQKNKAITKTIQVNYICMGY